MHKPRETRRRIGFLGLLVLLLLLALPGALQAQYTYTIDNGTVTITQYAGPGCNVTITSAINGPPVTRIGDAAFYLYTSLTYITIPGSVTVIEEVALH